MSLQFGNHVKVQYAGFTAVGAIFAQYLETKPRRVRNYAAKSLTFSDTKRAVLMDYQKLRRAVFETTPRNAFPVQCFPSFHGHTPAAEISYVELKYNNILIGDGPGWKLRRNHPAQTDPKMQRL